MVSTFGSLNTVVTGLMAQQLSINTTGHNISNASTDGYSRQRVNLVASSAQTIYTNGGLAQLGMGVTSQSITRIRDTFIDRQYWKENSVLGTNEIIKTYLTKIEDVFGEPLETGLETIMNNFWKSIETLSTDASNHSARAVAIQNGVSLCTTIQQEATQFRNMVSDINVMVGLRVNSINQLTEELLILNKQIAQIEAGKMDHANDLRDRRDYLTDQLSYMIDVQVTEDDEGNYLIYGGGIPLVTATTRQDLTTRSRMDPDYGYEVIDILDASTGKVMLFREGEIASMINVRDSEENGVKKYLNDLTNMAKFLLQEFNDVHKAGIDLNGNAGDNFFGEPGMIYNDTALNLTKGEWLAHLKVSKELTDPTTGTGKVAARTLFGEAAQSNPQSGHAVIGYTAATATAQKVIDEFKNNAAAQTPTVIPAGTPSGANWQFQNVTISAGITSVDSEGNVTGMDYTYTYNYIAVDPTTGERLVDATGKPYIGTTAPVAGVCTSITNTDTGSITFQLTSTDTAVNMLTIQVGRSTSNTPGSTYTFSAGGQMQGIAAGDNAVNLCNRLKKDISKTIGNSSLDTYYSTQMGALGVQAQNAERMADNQQAVVDQLLLMRESVCGVNQEEELTNMIRFQKAYDAAARILTAMDEMLDKLINGTGRVGA